MRKARREYYERRTLPSQRWLVNGRRKGDIPLSTEFKARFRVLLPLFALVGFLVLR